MLQGSPKQKYITIKKDRLDTILALPKLPYASPRRNKLILLPAGQFVHNWTPHMHLGMNAECIAWYPCHAAAKPNSNQGPPAGRAGGGWRRGPCVSCYTYPHAPFYREMKGLLHSENTPESREYFWCEHVHECLLHTVIYGADFIHLQVCH
jgi:hypothetical protein